MQHGQGGKAHLAVSKGQVHVVQKLEFHARSMVAEELDPARDLSAILESDAWRRIPIVEGESYPFISQPMERSVLGRVDKRRAEVAHSPTELAEVLDDSETGATIVRFGSRPNHPLTGLGRAQMRLTTRTEVLTLCGNSSQLLLRATLSVLRLAFGRTGQANKVRKLSY